MMFTHVLIMMMMMLMRERERERGNFQLLAAAHQPTTSPMHPVPVLCVVVAHVPDVIEQQAYWVT